MATKICSFMISAFISICCMAMDEKNQFTNKDDFTKKAIYAISGFLNKHNLIENEVSITEQNVLEYIDKYEPLLIIEDDDHQYWKERYYEIKDILLLSKLNITKYIIRDKKVLIPQLAISSGALKHLRETVEAEESEIGSEKSCCGIL